MKTFIRVSLSILISIMAIMVSSCTEVKEEIPVLRIAYAPHDHHSPLYIAALNGEYFKSNGGVYLRQKHPQKEYDLIAGEKIIAHVQLNSSTGGKEIIRKLSEGQYDMSFGGVPAVLHFIDQGVPIKILSPVMSEGAGLVMRKSLPIQNWQDFVGHVNNQDKPVRIGYKMAISVHNLIFESALREEKISYFKDQEKENGRIRIINLHGAHNLIPALKEDLIDGFVVNQPFLALAETQGVGNTVALFRELPPKGKWRGHPCCVFAAREGYIAAYPEVTEAVTTLVMRAVRYLGRSDFNSHEQIADWLNVPVEVEHRSMPTIHFTADLDEDWQKGVDFWVESMMAAGKLQSAVKDAAKSGNLEDVIYDTEVYQKSLGNL